MCHRLMAHPNKLGIKMTNHKSLYYTLIMCILLFSSCNLRKKQEFTVFYFCGDIDFNRQIECMTLDSLCMAAEYDDTIFIDCSIAKKIKYATRNVHQNKKQDTFTPVMYVNIENMGLCFNGINNHCWIRQNEMKYIPAIFDSQILYLIKWKSGYYNHLPYDILELDHGIRLYGVPSDYKIVKLNKTVKKKETFKVLMIEKS